MCTVPVKFQLRGTLRALEFRTPPPLKLIDRQKTAWGIIGCKFPHKVLTLGGALQALEFFRPPHIELSDLLADGLWNSRECKVPPKVLT